MTISNQNQLSPRRDNAAALWFCLLLLSSCTLLLSGIYHPTTIHYTFPYAQVVVLLATSVITAAVALRRIEFTVVERGAYLLLLALLIFVIFIPWPYRLPGLLLAAGLLLTPVKRLRKIVQPAANGLLCTGLVIAAQMLILPIFYLVFSRYHRLDLATPIVTLIMKAVGPEASTDAGALFVREGDRVFSFLTTWDSLGLYPIMNIWIGGLLTLWLFRNTDGMNERRQARRSSGLTMVWQRWEKAIYLSAILIGYLFLRYAAAIFFFLNLQDASVFWKHEFTFLTLLPLAVILPKWVPLEIDTKPAPNFPIDFKKKNREITNRRLLPAFLAASLLMLSLVGIWGFYDPGIKKAGHVLIDEKHSNWEWTTEEFDTKWYGQKSTYNYFSLFEYLRYFYDVEQSHNNLTDTLLNKCAVLILKTPTEPFAESEIEAIVNFVRRGGGLFLIGDHTNVFGITTNLNPLAQKFGLKFRYDFQSDITGELSIYKPPNLLPHPVVQRMPIFMFASGCMLEAPLTAENVIIGYGQKSLYLDYAEKNFFPREKNNEETMEFGLFVQAAGVRFGKGRVLGFTDSTVWSNFYMHILGKPELLLGCMEWLNRQNSGWGILRYLFLALALGSLAFLFVLGRQISRAEFLWTAIGTIALALPISMQAFAFISRACYPAPQPQRDFVQVNFEMQHSNYELPILHITKNPEHSFHTFYTWLQRLGMVPAIKTKFTTALDGAEVVALINPHRPFAKTELQQFEAYIEAGGKALILDDPAGHSVTNQLLAAFGMNTAPIFSDSAAVFSWHNGADSARFWGKLTGTVSGGTPLVYAEARQSNISSPLHSAFPRQPRLLANNPAPSPQDRRVDLATNHQNHGFVRQPVLALQRIGKGLLVVMSSSALFADREMGYSATTPKPNQQQIYELEFWIFSQLFGLGSRKSGLDP